MRIWTAILLVCVVIVLLALDATRADLFQSAASRYLPYAVTRRLNYRLDEQRGIVSHLARFGSEALDTELPAGRRLGAAELFWLCAALRGDGFCGDLFEARLGLLLEVAEDLPEEPGAWALVVDALRSHRAVCVDENDPAESRLARDVVRRSTSNFPDNGYFELFAAEVALAEGHESEARDSLVRASRARSVDPFLRERSSHAYRVLRRSGLPDLEAREFLIDDGYSSRNFSPGDMLDGIAGELGRRDARRVNREPDCWLETFVAIHDISRMLLDTTLLAVDAREGLEAGTTYLEMVRGGVATVHQPVPRSDSLDALAQRLAAAGYTSGAVSLRETQARARCIGISAAAGGSLTGGDRVLLATAAHAMFLPWAFLAFVIFVVFLPAARTARRRRTPVPSSPGVFVIAALMPLLLLVFLASGGHYPFDRPAAGYGWLGSLARPEPVVFLLPLAAILVILLPHLLVKRFRSAASFCRRTAAFFLVYAILLLLAFSVTAPLLQEGRQARADALGRLVVGLSDPPSWPIERTEP